MTDQELISLLRQAVTCLDRNDRGGFRKILHSAMEECRSSEMLMGEVGLLAVVSGEIAPDNLLDALLKAETMIKGSSKILTPQTRFAENHFDAFRLWGKKPGEADVIHRWKVNIEKIADVFQRLTGFGVGMNECYHAQLAYYRGDLEEALRWASVNVPCSEDGQISLMNVYLLEVQAGIAKHTMNQKLWRSAYGKIKAIASGEQAASRSSREQAEVVCTMLDMSLGCLHDVPAWVRTGDFGVIPTPDGYEIVSDRLLIGTLPGAMVAHMEYLSYSGEPAKALQAAAMIQQVLDIRNVVLDAYVSLLRAGCYLDLEKPDYAREAITEAMKIIVPDRLWLIAAEFVPAFGEMLCSVAREYDAEAPDRIMGIGEGYWDKLTPLRNEMLRGTAEGLTKREQEVMSLVMKGYSNAEIAEQMNVSVRTVRFHLENVYSKLNISRRSKFVSDIEHSGVYRLANWVK